MTTHQVEPQITVPVGELISQIPLATDRFPSDTEANHWRPRGCGIACLRMVLAANNIDDPGYYELITQGIKAGAYCDRGWIHQGLVNLAASHGLQGQTRRGTPDDIVDSLTTGHLVIASVTVRFLGGYPQANGHPRSPGGHLVMVTGVRSKPNKQHTAFRVHHPSSNTNYNWSNRWIANRPFTASFAGTYIEFVAPPATDTDP